MDFKPITMTSSKSDCVYWLIQCPWSKFRECDYSALLSFSRLALLHLCMLYKLLYDSAPYIHSVEENGNFMVNHKILLFNYDFI